LERIGFLFLLDNKNKNKNGGINQNHKTRLTKQKLDKAKSVHKKNLP
jgi:hypothetical protein